MLDSTTESIVVIEPNGKIIYVNSSWDSLGATSTGVLYQGWVGMNYLQVCDDAARENDRFAIKAAAGIRKVSRAEQDIYYLDYPCGGPTEQRWFMMRVTRFSVESSQFLVISHQDITERKVAEEQIEKLARTDEMTGLANRRCFEEFLRNQWKRSARTKTPLSLALIDIDHFKMINDTYGHSIGDKYLKFLSSSFSQLANRPEDICARYGGDEFAILLGDTDQIGGKLVMERLVENIRNLKIPNENAPTKPILTLSIGLSTMYPNKTNHYENLILSANNLMCSVKNSGRDAIAVTSLEKNHGVLNFKSRG